MASFHLAGLDPALLEKIITKLDEASYFRMRQTCRGMEEFIRKSKNISVKVERVVFSARLVFDENEPRQLLMIPMAVDFEQTIDIEVFYGVRLNILQLPKEEFSMVYEFLKIHRITCHELKLNDSNFTKEECANILNLLKPVKVWFSSEESTVYEAVFQSKTVTHIDAIIARGDVDTLLPRLLSKFEYVTFMMFGQSGSSGLFLSILKILCPQPPPNLLCFQLHALIDDSVDLDRVENGFREYGWVVKRNNQGCYGVDFPNGFGCGIKISDRLLQVYYGKNDNNSS